MNPFAIVETGGKQLRLEPGQILRVERLNLGKDSQEVVLDRVLMIHKGDSVTMGSPFLKGAGVVLETLGEVKGSKVISFKYKRRKNYRKKIGHRQIYSRLRVKEILGLTED